MYTPYWIDGVKVNENKGHQFERSFRGNTKIP
jgi:hypothetical protein